ncbi:MAG: hypothetical protein IJ594_03375 [Oscillospiraceae bacterium]|nr:hypothetical protein [Oscillospiraceae bacterium]
MEERLREQLEEGEQLLWTGKAEPYETLDAVHKRPFTLKCVIGYLIALAVIVTYVSVARETGIQPLLILLVLAIASIGPLNVLGDGRKLRRAVYAATDRRLIAVGENVRSVEYDKIAEAAFREDEAGHVSLLCGYNALKAKSAKWREITLVGHTFDEDDKSRCAAFALYAVDDANGLKKVLREKIPGVL